MFACQKALLKVVQTVLDTQGSSFTKNQAKIHVGPKVLFTLVLSSLSTANEFFLKMYVSKSNGHLDTGFQVENVVLPIYFFSYFAGPKYVIFLHACRKQTIFERLAEQFFVIQRNLNIIHNTRISIRLFLK